MSKIFKRFDMKSSVEDICEINSSFDKGVLKIAYAGSNVNGSNISKEVFDKCKYTIYNIPIVCNYDREEDDFGGHDVDIVPNGKGDLRIVNVTTPVGVIPESANVWWDDSDGKEYLCAETLLWKRQEAYRKIKKDKITAQSMEILITDCHMDNKELVVDDFEFTAFCLLGPDTKPAFPDARIEVFNSDGFKQEFMELMLELKEIATVTTADAVDIENIAKEGDGEKMEIQEIITQPSDEPVIEDVVVEEVQEIEVTAEEPTTEPATEEEIADASAQEESPIEASGEPIEETFASQEGTLTGQQLQDALSHALDGEEFEDEFRRRCKRYSFCDFSITKGEAYYFELPNWELIGFSYSVSGDVVSVETSSRKKCKFAIVDVVEGESDNVSELISDTFAAIPKHTQELDEAKSELASATSELESLRVFKRDIEAAEREAQVEATFAAFEDLIGNDAFEALKSDCSNLEISDIEEKCFAIRGRTMVRTFSVNKESTPRLPIERIENDTNTVYGGLFDQFPPQN